MTAAALGAVELMLLLWEPRGPAWVLALFPIVGSTYVATGLFAWSRRPSNRTGELIVLGGVAWFAAGLANTVVAPLIAVGAIASTLPLALVVHLLHAFPSGRLRGAASRATVAGAYFVALVLQAPVYLVGQGADPPVPAIAIADRPDLAALGADVQNVAGAVVMAATALLLLRRSRRAAPAQRRVLAPLYVYGVAAVLFVPLSARVARELGGDWSVWLAAVQLAALAGLPVALALVMLRGGFAATGRIEELGGWLGADAADRAELVDALADVLGDPTLELLYWAPESGGYVDRAGRPVDPHAARPGRATAEVDLDGRRIGAIVYDGDLIADPELVLAAGRVTALALDRERLHAELLASHERLLASRARLAEAADSERRRIARDLHDGLQARLLALALDADALAIADGSPPATRTAAASLRTRLDASVTELRELVQGLMPAALLERGLAAAAEDLADQLPVATDVASHLDGAPLPAAVESTGYLVVAEALANAVKHADASSLTVRLQHAGASLRIEVRDDGVGGATVGRGNGLRGMRDRVDALGGSLAVTSPPGDGTTIVAELPCAS